MPMFCPNCGTTCNKKLKYCKNCGERLSKAAEVDKDGTPGKMLDNILTTIFLVVMFGLGILVGLVAVLLANGLEPRLVVVISIAYLAATFGICFTLVQQVPKLIDARLKWMQADEDARVQARFAPITDRQLHEYRDPVSSVTDRTTRALEQVPQERS